MRQNRKFFLLIVVILTATIMTTVAGLRGSSQSDPAAPAQADESQYPVADYAASELTDPREHVPRRDKNKRYNLPDRSINPARFMFSEDSSPVSLELPEAHAPAETALPVDQSDAVVVGEVTEARAFLSDDKTSVYSEFTIRVEEVFKQRASSDALSAGTIITADRPGGRVRLPSGKLLLRGVLGKTMPRPGRRHLLFLKRPQDGQDFLIITGYELRAGRVFPLDGNLKLKQGGKIRQFAPYDLYEGTDEINFLNDVRSAIATAAQPAPTGGGPR